MPWAIFPGRSNFTGTSRKAYRLPRWASDLDRGAGQPTFLFVPPMLHYVAEVWQVATPDLQTAINLATATLVVASPPACSCSAGFTSAPPAASSARRLRSTRPIWRSIFTCAPR